MTIDNIRHIAIIGTGIMGSGVGVEFARFGYDVKIYDIRDDAIEKAMILAREDLDIMVKAGLITAAEVDASLARLCPVSDFREAVADSHYVLEAAPEKLPLKQDIFTRLDGICSPQTILASTTSSLSATEIAAKTRHPERVLVTHYYSPPHLMPLVEVFPGEKTDASVIETVKVLMQRLRKKALIFDKKRFVRIGNRLQSAISNEAQAMFDEGISPQEIDGTITFGFGRRMAFEGYFQRMDMVGIDGRLERYTAMGLPPWPPIAERIKRGDLGVKTGKGFHDWPGNTAQQLDHRMKTYLARMIKDDIDEGLI